jgi:hypothetical protein
VVYQVMKPLYCMPHSGRCLHVTWSNWLESQGFQKARYEGAMWSRRAFTEKLLKAFGFWQYSKPTKTPQAPGTRLSASDKPDTPDPVLHRRCRAIVGALGWLNQGTRPDISHAYSELSKFVQSQGQKHMDAAEYCLKYLAGTANLCIHYGRTKDGKSEGRDLNRLWGWADADFAADPDTRRSHTGYVIMINGGPISWKSEAEECVSQHSRKRVVCRQSGW